MRILGAAGITPSSADAGSQLAIDVQYYLTQQPRQLPSRHFYDALGSALFDAICQLPWYPLMRAELRLLEAHGRHIIGSDVSTIIELGPGNGGKLSALIVAAGSRRSPLDLHIVDVSASALAQATATLERLPDVRVTAHETTYEAGLDAFAVERPTAGRSLAIFLGSNIGNFDPPGREAFLRNVRMALRPGDGFLLGADLIKPERDLVLAYDDPLGVTAAFNRNVLVRVNRELGGNFDLDRFRHRAVWDRVQSRIEMHLVCTRAQQIVIPAASLDFRMHENESIWTESSYKFAPPQIASALQRCGFEVRAQWIDDRNPFALTHAAAV
jgi:L-histidine Nalpha-methyltransferase